MLYLPLRRQFIQDWTINMEQSNFFEDLANTIIYHRKKSGLNRVDLARLAGVGKTVVYDIEHAKSTVRLDTLMKILNVLNITIKLESPLISNFREIENEKS